MVDYSMVDGRSTQIPNPQIRNRHRLEAKRVGEIAGAQL